MYLSENATNTTLSGKQMLKACNHTTNNYNKVRIPNLSSMCEKKVVELHYKSINTSANKITVANATVVADPAAMNTPVINMI